MKLPTIDTSDGQLIRGTRVKCNDGHWFTQDDTNMSGRQFLGLATTAAVQRWTGEAFETIFDEGKGLPDVGELNAAIPRDQWEIGLDGQPRAPWQRVYAAYLLDPDDASLFTFVNGTIGARLAWQKLIERVTWMRALRGAGLFPVIRLDSKPMKTQFGTKMRPEFTIVDWRDLGGEGTPALESPAA